MSDRMLDNLLLARATLDRAAHRRADQEWLDEQMASTDARFLFLHDGLAPLDATGALQWSHDRAPGDVFFLGLDGEEHPHFAISLPERPDLFGDQWTDLRQAGAGLSDADAGALVAAVALANWHRTHSHCPRCGAATVPVLGGWVRRCVADDSEHYPRTDPAVIMLVIDDDERALFGRQRLWPEGFYSTLAGFVEPGESAEAAVRREVFEESGVKVGDMTYLGSQPWPFPCSLMLGYHARALSIDITIDGHEIGDARWFSRDELRDACDAGEVRMPPPISIARRLIERWFGPGLKSEWDRPPIRR